MMSRFNQGSQQAHGVDVQPRPTFAEKVIRLKPAPLLGSSNRPTSYNLTVRRQARTPAYTYTRAPVCVRNLVIQVRRLYSSLFCMAFFRPTTKDRLYGHV